MNIVLLSGGSGIRLWPLSNNVKSKQFLKIFRKDSGEHESMVQRMYRMINEMDPSADVTVATAAEQVELLRAQLGQDVQLCIEPSRRDTFPAIALAAAYLHDVKNKSENEIVVVCPVDPLVERGYFEKLRDLVKEAQSCNLALMGIKPTYPSEKYGYILRDAWGQVKEFKEKPDLNTAEQYLKLGALWNGGVFAFRLSYVLEKTQELCGTNKFKELLGKYETLPKISFDYAVAEHESNIRVLEYEGEWKDLGTWNTLTEALTEPTSGNVVLGEDCSNVHVINELGIPMLVLGLKDVAVVATPDGILVTDKEASSHMKKYL